MTKLFKIVVTNAFCAVTIILLLLTRIALIKKVENCNSRRGTPPFPAGLLKLALSIGPTRLVSEI